MNTKYLTAFMISLFAVSAIAEGDAPKPTDTQQIKFLKKKVAESEAVVNKHIEKLRAKDAEIEKGINDIINLISSVKDSKESKTRITNVREDVIDGLNKSVEFYRQRRASRIQVLRNNSATMEDADGDKIIDFLDKLIDKRIEQILYITGTMTTKLQWTESEKYDYVRNGSGYKVKAGKSDEFVRHRKNLSKSNLTRKKTDQILEKNRAVIERENRKLEAHLKSQITDADRAATQDMIAKNNKRLEEQRKETTEMVDYGHESGRAIGRSEAFKTDQRVEQMAEGVIKSHREFVHMASLGKNDMLTMNLWKRRLKKAEAFVAAKQKAEALAADKQKAAQPPAE
jgi:hypothetical protein